MRIVSLLPSATEIVDALGLYEQLVGVSFECDTPPLARTDKAVVVGGLDTLGLTPSEIDALVRTELAAGRDLYTLKAGALAGLAPDLLITQDLCQVCALPAGQLDQALQLIGCQAEVLSLDPHRLDEVIDSVQLVARAA
ncbi:MAG: cobalamin-binding protein, partial [Jatrophihabitantaceae bacterium]